MLTKPMFARLLKRYMPTIAGPDMLDTVFQVMDINHDGKVSLDTTHPAPADAPLRLYSDEVVLTRCGQIDFREFCLGVSRLMKGTFDDKLEFTFSLLDPAGTGNVAVSKLVPIIKNGNSEMRHLVDYVQEVHRHIPCP